MFVVLAYKHSLRGCLDYSVLISLQPFFTCFMHVYTRVDRAAEGSAHLLILQYLFSD